MSKWRHCTFLALSGGAHAGVVAHSSSHAGVVAHSSPSELGARQMAPAGAVTHWPLTTQLRLSRLRGLPGMFNGFEVVECVSSQLGFFSVILEVR